MFTGIVQGQATIASMKILDEFMQLRVKFPKQHSDNFQAGASIALNGTCLTITEFSDDVVCFDLIKETLRVTNLGNLTVGDHVNFERAARFGDEIGGHVLSGHIHDQIAISRIEKTENNCVITFTVSPDKMKYIFSKGFVALNGCSLTVGEVLDNTFNVYLIPETLAVTGFGSASTGDKINLEVDAHTQAVVDTVENYLKQKHE